MDTPRRTKLYNQIAKDYSPKQAEMMICKYIEGLEARIVALEGATPGEDDDPAKVREARVSALEARLVAVEKEASAFLADGSEKKKRKLTAPAEPEPITE